MVIHAGLISSPNLELAIHSNLIPLFLPRSIIVSDDRSHPWRLYPHLVEVAQAFKTLKNDLSIRPIDRQLETRIEVHI